MSINDELLNYELGEDIDDHALLGVDEDDLLLSDEDIEKETLNIKTNECTVGTLEKNVKLIGTEQITIESSVEMVEASSVKQQEQHEIPKKISEEHENSVSQDILRSDSDVTTSADIPIKKPITLKRALVKKLNEVNDIKKLIEPIFNNNINDAIVTSTNKDIEHISTAEIQVNEQSILDTQSDLHKIISSQEIEVMPIGSSDPTEDEEERAERTNIKQTNEREENGRSSPDPESSPENIFTTHRYQPGKRSNRGGRGAMHFPVGLHGSHPRYAQPYPQIYPQNDQFPPQQYPSYGMETNGPVFHSFHPPNLSGLPSRMDFRSGPNGFRPQNSNEFGMFPRVRLDFIQNPMVNGSGYGPGPGLIRPTLFRAEMRPRLPLRPQGPPRISGNYGNPPMMNNTLRPQQTMNQIRTPTVPAGNGQSPVLSGKILINPNFKGGVEAATNQLIKDTNFMQTISPHVSHLQSDEELLRQQEEFINKNREHIEKRRYARSRSRSRERSYSPPNRRDRYDRDNKRGGFRGNRGRRGSRDFDKFPKRRRSYTPDRKKDSNKTNEDEDEETRAYRLEIEKQKAMREKILRDKEMRRRRAAEEKIGAEDKPNDEPPLKLKPIIVTESKIISLKKNKDAETQVNSTNSTNSSAVVLAIKAAMIQKSENIAIKRTIPTAKILPEAKRTVADHIVKDSIPINTSITTSSKNTSTAVVKPVMKKPATFQADINKEEYFEENEDELLEEDRLLADTPSPPPSPEISHKKSLLTSNRKVVILKSSKNENSVATDSIDENKKGIFNRLERKKFAVNETAKRSIRRMFTNNE